MGINHQEHKEHKEKSTLKSNQDPITFVQAEVSVIFLDVSEHVNGLRLILPILFQ